MTRQTPISEVMSGRKTTKGSVPKAGTRLRAVYDMARSGRWFTAEELGFSGTRIHASFETLSNFYGQEFESRTCADQGGRLGRSGGRYKEYRLRGEWEGAYFVPLERILQTEAA